MAYKWGWVILPNHVSVRPGMILQGGGPWKYPFNFHDDINIQLITYGSWWFFTNPFWKNMSATSQNGWILSSPIFRVTNSQRCLAWVATTYFFLKRCIQAILSTKNLGKIPYKTEWYDVDGLKEIRVQLTGWGEGSWNPHYLHGFSTIPTVLGLPISDPINGKKFPQKFPTLFVNFEGDVAVFFLWFVLISHGNLAGNPLVHDESGSCTLYNLSDCKEAWLENLLKTHWFAWFQGEGNLNLPGTVWERRRWRKLCRTGCLNILIYPAHFSRKLFVNFDLANLQEWATNQYLTRRWSKG